MMTDATRAAAACAAARGGTGGAASPEHSNLARAVADPPGPDTYGQLFVLVPDDSEPPENAAEVYAWGMQVTTGSAGFAVVVGGGGLLGVHDSAESACARHSNWSPLELRWAGPRIPFRRDAPDAPAQRRVCGRA